MPRLGKVRQAASGETFSAAEPIPGDDLAYILVLHPCQTLVSAARRWASVGRSFLPDVV